MSMITVKSLVWFNFLLFRNTGWLRTSSNKMANKEDSKLPEFILEKEFQCHNTALIKDVVCKTIQKFVKRPQDVRLSITVSFQPLSTADAISHEQEAIAVIQVDKPGNFYPGGQEQRQRDKEIETLRQVEKEKHKERREMRKINREEEERKRRKMEQGVKRPSGSINGNRTERMTRVAPPLPFKAEIRRLPTGEMYAVREWIYDRVGKESKIPYNKLSPTTLSPLRIEYEKPKVYESRRPSVEEMDAIREIGEPRDDTTDRDGSSLETIDVQSLMEPPPQKTTAFTDLAPDSRVETKGPFTAEGSIRLEDDGKSPKVLAYISVG